METKTPADELAKAEYVIEHINYGSDDGTLSSKFRIDFLSFSYPQAKEIFDLVVERSGYKRSKLILKYNLPIYLPHISELRYEDALPIARKVLTNGDRGSRVLIERFKEKKAQAFSGRIRGEIGHATGRAYITCIPDSAHRIFASDEEKMPVGKQTAIKTEMILEVNFPGGDFRWAPAKKLEFKDRETEAFRKGIVEILGQFIVSCPYCSVDVYVEELGTRMKDAHSCGACQRLFYVVLFE